MYTSSQNRKHENEKPKWNSNTQKQKKKKPRTKKTQRPGLDVIHRNDTTLIGRKKGGQIEQRKGTEKNTALCARLYDSGPSRTGIVHGPDPERVGSLDVGAHRAQPSLPRRDTHTATLRGKRREEKRARKEYIWINLAKSNAREADVKGSTRTKKTEMKEVPVRRSPVVFLVFTMESLEQNVDKRRKKTYLSIMGRTRLERAESTTCEQVQQEAEALQSGEQGQQAALKNVCAIADTQNRSQRAREGKDRRFQIGSGNSTKNTEGRADRFLAEMTDRRIRKEENQQDGVGETHCSLDNRELGEMKRGAMADVVGERICATPWIRKMPWVSAIGESSKILERLRMSGNEQRSQGRGRERNRCMVQENEAWHGRMRNEAEAEAMGSNEMPDCGARSQDTMGESQSAM
ncbi:hypothetical protein C8R45DRAFT_923561 [Mycena sanguinolenta]|nr:hypothetical protein C8R45DRAFT_923561 [Mycena sanguinolenta]